MKIAFVTLQYAPHDLGGIGTYVQTVATALAASGHDVTVVCPARGQMRSTAIEDGVRVERFPVAGPERLWRRFVTPGHELRVRIHHAVSTALALWRLGERFDVIEVPEWKAQGLLLRRRSVVTHLHLSLELQHTWNDHVPTRNNRISYLLERTAARRAAARTTTSRQTTRFPDRSQWLPDDDVEMVVPPVLTSDWSAHPVTETPPSVLFVGRLERRKAPELLVEALGLLIDDVPDLSVVYAGRSMNIEGRPYADLVAEWARSHGIPCEIRPPVSERSEIDELYRGARVVAVPSRFEPLSMVAFEAMACGRPVVMTDQVGAMEWFGPALPELVVPFGDASALAAALRPHLVDPAHAASTGERGRALVAETCSVEHIVESRVRVYERVVEGTRGSFL